MNTVASKKWSAIIFLLAILIGTLVLSGVPFLVSHHNANVYEGLVGSGTVGSGAVGSGAVGGTVGGAVGSTVGSTVGSGSIQGGVPGANGGGINSPGLYTAGGSAGVPGANGGGINSTGSPPASNQNILIPVASFNAFISSMMTDATTFFGSVKSANAVTTPAPK